MALSESVIRAGWTDRVDGNLARISLRIDRVSPFSSHIETAHLPSQQIRDGSDLSLGGASLPNWHIFLVLPQPPGAEADHNTFFLRDLRLAFRLGTPVATRGGIRCRLPNVAVGRSRLRTLPPERGCLSQPLGDNASSPATGGIRCGKANGLRRRSSAAFG